MKCSHCSQLCLQKWNRCIFQETPTQVGDLEKKKKEKQTKCDTCLATFKSEVLYRLCVIKIRGFYSNAIQRLLLRFSFFMPQWLLYINPLLNNFLTLLFRKQFKNVKVNNKINNCLSRNRAKMRTIFFSNIAAQQYSNRFIRKYKFEPCSFSCDEITSRWNTL